MSTFNGIVKEIPCLRVDKFNNNDVNSAIFFISHCHTDHMEGIDETFFEMLKIKKLYLYGSPISVRILKNSYQQYENQLKELPVDETTLISTNYNNKDIYITVSVMPAYHCPGSVMFLFETSNVRVLYTGDFRVENVNHFFNQYFAKYKVIDNIYLDTTFLKKCYPYFPSRKESSTAICEIIESWINLSDKNVIYIWAPAFFGSEYLFMDIFKKTHQKVHVPADIYCLHKYIPDMDRCITENDDHKNIRVHFKCADSTPACRINTCNSAIKCTIRVTAMIWNNYKIGDSAKICENANFYKVCASYHPSYNETLDFIKCLKPINIEPCVEPKDEDEKKEMLMLIQKTLGYKNEIKKVEDFKIDPIYVGYNEVDCNQQSPKADILSSPPRKFASKTVCKASSKR